MKKPRSNAGKTLFTYVHTGAKAKIGNAKSQVAPEEGRGNGSPEEYSDTELSSLREAHYRIIDSHVFTSAPGAAAWQRLHGNVADAAFGYFFRYSFREGDPSLKFPEAPEKLLSAIGTTCVDAILRRDSNFFRGLAASVEAIKDGRKLSTLTRRELFLPPKKGRNKSPNDLSRVFPIALSEASRRRLIGHSEPPELSRRRITRGELMAIVRSFGGTISEGELSRWLARFQFSQYMAEQPIARKRTTKR